MSMACERFNQVDTAQIEMFGALNTNGWLPGTFLVWSNDVADRGRLAVRHFAEGGGKLSTAFFSTGTMTIGGTIDRRFANRNEPSGLWTEDEGEALTRGDVNNTLSFDRDGMAGRVGIGNAAAALMTGVWKFYVFERWDAARRAGGAGAELDWHNAVGHQAYVSSRGLLTCEAEAGVNGFIPMAIAGHGFENNWEYVVIASL